MTFFLGSLSVPFASRFQGAGLTVAAPQLPSWFLTLLSPVLMAGHVKALEDGLKLRFPWMIAYVIHTLVLIAGGFIPTCGKQGLVGAASTGSRVKLPYIQLLALLIIHCMAWGKLFHPPVPHCSH